MKLKDKYSDLARKLKMLRNYEGDGDTNCNWCTRNDPQKLGKETVRIENHPNYSIAEVG